MDQLEQKAAFLRERYPQLLEGLDEHTERQWGKMDVRQMIEHMSDYIRIASGRTPMEVVTPEENIARMQAFLASEKPFRENTPNALMSDTSPAYRQASKADAIAELRAETAHFFEVFQNAPTANIKNPFFGALGYEQQVQLLHKHATHHLRQFGVNESGL